MKKKWLLAISLIGMTSGCGFSFFSNNTSLQGTWQLVATTDSGLGKTYLTFDGDGQVTQIKMMIGETEKTYTDITTQSSVSGSTVIFTVSFGDGFLAFEGVFDGSETGALGTLSATIHSDEDIIFQGKPARLLKR